MEEKHDSSRNIIIAIIVIAIIAILGYFIYASALDNDEEAITNDTMDTTDDNTNDTTFNEVGAYTGMETYGDEESTGTIELVLNSDNTASLVLIYDDTKEYTGTYSKSGNIITFTASEKETSTDDNSVADNVTDTITGDEEETDSDSDKTFTFTITDDNLYYTSDETSEEIKLDKVDRNTLKYINE